MWSLKEELVMLWCCISLVNFPDAFRVFGIHMLAGDYLIDAKQSNKDDVVHRAGCQNPLSIRLCPEHSWILPDICGGISQRTHAQGD